MKRIIRFNPGFVGAITLGLIIAWSVAVPVRTSGEGLWGNCKYCTQESYITCGNQGEGKCQVKAYQCVIVETGSGTCYRGSPSGCMTHQECQSTWHEACIGS